MFLIIKMYYPLGTGCLWVLTGYKQNPDSFVSVPQGAKADWHQDIWPSEKRARWNIKPPNRQSN